MTINKEDLKVGMVFDTTYSYFKIIHIIANRKIIYLIKNKTHDDIELDFGFNSNKEDFLSHPHELKLLDKVPPKTVEVEEDIIFYISQDNYNKIIENRRKFDLLISLYENDIGFGSKSIELCKVKRKVIKTLDFNWETGTWM